jgi:hypothetical protein
MASRAVRPAIIAECTIATGLGKGARMFASAKPILHIPSLIRVHVDFPEEKVNRLLDERGMRKR